MANNPVRPAVKTPREKFQTSEDDNVSWNGESKMATKFYKTNKLPAKDARTSGKYAYGDSELDF